MLVYLLGMNILGMRAMNFDDINKIVISFKNCINKVSNLNTNDVKKIYGLKTKIKYNQM